MSKNKNNIILLENLQIFEDVLSSFTLNTPFDKNGWSSFEIKSEVGVELNYKVASKCTWVIWYKESHNLNITSIRKKIMKLLEDNNLIVNDQICNIFLAAFAMLNNNGSCAIDRINLLLNNIVDADLSQFFTFIHQLPMRNNTTFGSFRIGKFTIGPFPSEIVESRCVRAGSDYAKKYKSRFNKYTFSIYSEPEKCKVLDWYDLTKVYNVDIFMNSRIYSLIDYYFYVMSQVSFELFFKELRLLQEIPQAFGSGWFDVDAMMHLFDTDRLSIWLDIGGKNGGWVSPGMIGQVRIDFGGFHIGLPYVYAELKKQFGNWEKSTELYNVIRLYCSYLAKARISEHIGHTADALLNYVIALDLLLGEKGSSSDSFSTRCAALTYLVLSREYKDLVRDCKLVYDARSRYVHEGKVPEYNSIEKINRVSKEIALCLFRLNKNPWGNEEGFHKKWILYIDVLVAKINAAQQPSTDDYSNAGVAQNGEYCYLDLLNGLSSKN